jgi:hypothetical protein
MFVLGVRRRDGGCLVAFPLNLEEVTGIFGCSRVAIISNRRVKGYPKFSITWG